MRIEICGFSIPCKVRPDALSKRSISIGSDGTAITFAKRVGLTHDSGQMQNGLREIPVAIHLNLFPRQLQVDPFGDEPPVRENPPG